MTATLQYDNVMMNNEMTIASGMSFVGLLASSPVKKKKHFVRIERLISSEQTQEDAVHFNGQRNRATPKPAAFEFIAYNRIRREERCRMRLTDVKYRPTKKLHRAR